jgi:glycosyltransferase involved in cell wall biosynthesis
MPAWNEEESVAMVVKEAQAAVPEADILVVDDDSADLTAAAARQAGADVIRNVFNLGVGGAMRVGFRHAARRGYSVVVQVDADGQHDPRDIPRLIQCLDEARGDVGSTSEEPHVVIGARFAGVGRFPVPRARRVAMRMLSSYLSRLTGTELTDVTSGFRAYNRPAIELFARTYPAEYLSDTVESLVIASRAGARITQVPVSMRPRLAGTPSQSSWRAVGYLLRVSVMLVLERIRRHPQPDQSEEDQ